MLAPFALLAALAATASPASAADLPGFDCADLATHPARARYCVGRVPAYPNDVAVVLAPSTVARAGRPADDALDVVLYLHGHNHNHLGIRQYLATFQIPQALAASGRDAILIAPLSHGPKSVQHEAALRTPAGYRAFMTQILEKTRDAGLALTAEPRSITLSGHSGAYRGLSAILRGGMWADRTRELFLFDAVYDPRPEFVAFARDPSHRMWAVGTPTGGTLVHSSCLLQKLETEGLGHYGCAPYRDACGASPKPDPTCAPPADYPAEDWARERLGFFVHPGGHNDAARAFLPRFLRSDVKALASSPDV